MDEMVYLFVDSNVLLHYKPLAEIDWCGLLGAKTARIMICMPVIKELDKKKSDSRLSERAKRAIKEIDAQMAPGIFLRANVALEIYNKTPTRKDFPEELEFEVTDDRIIALVRDFSRAHPEHRVVLATEDLGMRIKCDAHGVATVKPHEPDRLENPGDELGRKVKQLQAEVLAQQNRQPKLLIAAAAPGQEPYYLTPFSCEISEDWIRLDPEEEVAQAQRKYRKSTEPGAQSSPFGGLNVQATVERFLASQIDPEDRERYQRDLGRYYSEIKEYALRYNTWAEINARTIHFDIWLKNEGVCSATDVDARLHFPPKLAGVGEADSEHSVSSCMPTPPKAPVPPRARNEFKGLEPQLYRPISPSLGLMDIFKATALTPPDPEKPIVYVQEEREKGHTVCAKIGRLRQWGTVHIGKFCAVFDDWGKVSPFEIEYEFLTNEHPNKPNGRLLMKVQRARR